MLNIKKNNIILINKCDIIYNKSSLSKRAVVMNGIVARIPEFFIPIGLSTIVDNQVKISPIRRSVFIFASTLASVIFIKKIVMSIFYLLCNVLTLGLNQGLRASFSKNIQEGLICAGAIPVGLLGMLFPQTINRRVLGIPDDCLWIDCAVYENLKPVDSLN